MLVGSTRMLALRRIALGVLAVWAATGHAVGLGRLQIQSWIGQPLRATVQLVGTDHDAVSATCFKAKIVSSDGDFVTAPRVLLTRDQQSTSITILSQQAMNEPAVTISVAIECGTPIHREYPVLLDPPLVSASLSEPPPAQAANPHAGVDHAATRSLRTAPAEGSIEAKPKQELAGANPAQANIHVASRSEARAEKANRSTRPSPPKAKRAVLKLSGSDTNPLYDLKLTTTLSAIESESHRTEEIRSAQRRFAALLTNEDTLQSAELQAGSDREQIQKLRSEIDRLKDRSRSDQAMLDRLQKSADPLLWVPGLLGLLLTSLGAIAWLAWRSRITRSSIQPQRWEDIHSAGGSEPGAAGSEALAIRAESTDSTVLPAESSPAQENASGQPTATEFSGNRLDDQPTTMTLVSPEAKSSASESVYALHRLTPENGAAVPLRYGTRAENGEAVQVSDILQEVEFWMLLNDRTRVLEILEPLSKVNKSDSPVPWLYLLDTYREFGNHGKYDALRERLKQTYNVHLGPWDDQAIADTQRDIDDFPHLANQICELWHSDRVVMYMSGLLLDDRDGTRQGFDLPFYRDLIMLIALAKDVHHIA